MICILVHVLHSLNNKKIIINVKYINIGPTIKKIKEINAIIIVIIIINYYTQRLLIAYL